MTINNEDINGVVSSFRPLIRGFFFYSREEMMKDESLLFPSPHSGILFLYTSANRASGNADRMFPSPHSGILFLSVYLSPKSPQLLVSVPSFGDSFFIRRRCNLSVIQWGVVSVPSFGDSFFIMALKPSHWAMVVTRFRPLIRGFFFYLKTGCGTYKA